MRKFAAWKDDTRRRDRDRWVSEIAAKLYRLMLDGLQFVGSNIIALQSNPWNTLIVCVNLVHDNDGLGY